MEPNVFDVACYILKKQGFISAMRLQKLMYYSQAWSLVWDNKPLFHNRIEAWPNGPVVRDLYDIHQEKYLVSAKDFSDHSSGHQLYDKQQDTIDTVLKSYGNKSALWLTDKSHLEDPWLNARIGLSDTERGDHEITLESMMEYYASL